MNSRKLQPRIGIDLGGTKIEIVVLKSDGNGVGAQVGSKTAFVADRRAETLFAQHLLQIVENFAATTQGLTKSVEPERHDHELKQYLLKWQTSAK